MLRSLHKFGLAKPLRLRFWSLTYRSSASLRANSPPNEKTARRWSFRLYKFAQKVWKPEKQAFICAWLSECQRNEPSIVNSCPPTVAMIVFPIRATFGSKDGKHHQNPVRMTPILGSCKGLQGYCFGIVNFLEQKIGEKKIRHFSVTNLWWTIQDSNLRARALRARRSQAYPRASALNLRSQVRDTAFQQKETATLLGGCFFLVDDTRLELVTSRTSSGCATSCANRPFSCQLAYSTG